VKKQFDLIEWRFSFFTKDCPEMKINNTLSVFLCMLLSVSTYAADESAPVIMDAGPCLALTRPIERLTCFEDQAQAAQRPGASLPQQNLPVVSIPRNTAIRQAEPVAEPEAPAVAVRTGAMADSDFEDNFGIREEDNDGQDKGTELVARVADIKELNPNRKLITLENGQAWEQMGTRRFILAEGDEIRIYPSRWGSSYRLASQAHKGFIQVQRLR
jgi:hypothetical protein